MIAYRRWLPIKVGHANSKQTATLTGGDQPPVAHPRRKT
jgi:hypothetical protein